MDFETVQWVNQLSKSIILDANAVVQLIINNNTLITLF